MPGEEGGQPNDDLLNPNPQDEGQGNQDMGAQGAQDDESQGEQGAQGNQGQGQPKKSEPYHLNPRFKEIMTKFKTEREQRIRLEEENRTLKSQQQQPKTPEGGANLSEEDKQIDSMFEGAPDAMFKEVYPEGKAGVVEFYRDIRRAIFRDMGFLRQTQIKKDQEAQEQKLSNFTAAWQRIESQLGSDNMDDFKQFALAVAAENPDSEVDITEVYELYLKDFYKRNPEEKPNPSKIAAKQISKVAKPAMGGSNRPSYQQIKNMSYEDLARQGMGQS